MPTRTRECVEVMQTVCWTKLGQLNFWFQNRARRKAAARGTQSDLKFCKWIGYSISTTCSLRALSYLMYNINLRVQVRNNTWLSPFSQIAFGGRHTEVQGKLNFLCCGIFLFTHKEQSHSSTKVPVWGSLLRNLWFLNLWMRDQCSTFQWWSLLKIEL